MNYFEIITRLTNLISLYGIIPKYIIVKIRKKKRDSSSYFF